MRRTLEIQQKITVVLLLICTSEEIFNVHDNIFTIFLCCINTTRVYSIIFTIYMSKLFKCLENITFFTLYVFLRWRDLTTCPVWASAAARATTEARIGQELHCTFSPLPPFWTLSAPTLDSVIDDGTALAIDTYFYYTS